MNLAEQNKQQCDEMLKELEQNGWLDSEPFHVEYIGLNFRYVVTKDKNALAGAMDWLTGSFSFEAKEILMDNHFGYEIALPLIILD